MGRPPLPVGTWGDINVQTTTSGRYEARTRYRDYDGVTRYVRRAGDTPRKAKTALTAALADRARTIGEEITAESRLTDLATMWAETLNDRSDSTRHAYRQSLDHHLLPALGQRRLREITTQTVERTLNTITDRHGPATARRARTVLSQIMGLALRMDALDRNPVTDSKQIATKKPEPRALTATELAQVRDAVAAHEAKGRSKADLADVIETQVATGARIGEVLALRWEDVDLDAGTVTIAGTVALTAEPPRRPFRQDHPKTSTSRRVLRLPDFGVAVLLRRSVEGPQSDLVFPSSRDTVRDTGSVRKSLRLALKGTGLEWVSTHTFRRTVATTLQDPEVAAAVLGNGPEVARRHYVERAAMAPDVRNVLDQLAPQSGA